MPSYGGAYEEVRKLYNFSTYKPDAVFYIIAFYGNIVWHDRLLGALSHIHSRTYYVHSFYCHCACCAFYGKFSALQILVQEVWDIKIMGRGTAFIYLSCTGIFAERVYFLYTRLGMNIKICINDVNKS